MTDSFFLIKWPVNFDETYNYGSLVEFSNGTVKFSNTQMSPGMKIHTWESKSNYFRDSRTLRLPLLKVGSTYKIKTKINQVPVNSVHVQIDFFDFQNKLIKSLILTDVEGDFKVPEDTKHYKISLINLNNRELKFEYIMIIPVECDYNISVYSQNNKVVALWNAKKIESINIFVRNKVIDSNSYIGKDNEIKLYVEIDGDHMFVDKSQIISEITKMLKLILSKLNLKSVVNIPIDIRFQTKNDNGRLFEKELYVSLKNLGD